MSRWVWAASLSVAAVWAYLVSVLLYGRSVAGVAVGLAAWALMVMGVAMTLIVTLRRRWRSGQLSEATLKNIFVATLTTVLGLLFLDVALFWVTGPPRTHRSPSTDAHIWTAEVYPRLYYPNRSNVRIHKPNVEIKASHYGDLYFPRLLDSPTLRDSVLALKRVTLRINAEGFRETDAIAEARTVALGDSFTFGWGLDEGESWVPQLEWQLGRKIYNLGLQDSSPFQELELLEYVIENYDPPIERVLWMLYEGNDLEDSYATRRPARYDGGNRPRLAGTIVEHLADIPKVIRDQSVIERLRTGRIKLRSRTSASVPSALRVDGVDLLHPIYRSPTLGCRMFHAPTLERVRRGPDYVLGHPNLPRLEATFRGMRELAARRGFEVVVLIAPTAARVYADHFDGFPPIAPPTLVEQLLDLSSAMEFVSIDLLEKMRPRARDELFYFRDDDHWNADGHLAVAEWVAADLGRDAAGRSH